MLRPLRIKMGMLRPLRLKSGILQVLQLKMGIMRLCDPNRYVATLRDPNKIYRDHCDSKRVYCDFVRPKYLRDFARPKQICCDFEGTQIRCVATTATQNGHVATLKEPKLVVLRPLRLKMGMLRLCANEIFARLCGIQKRYVATLRDPN